MTVSLKNCINRHRFPAKRIVIEISALASNKATTGTKLFQTEVCMTAICRLSSTDKNLKTRSATNAPTIDAEKKRIEIENADNFGMILQFADIHETNHGNGNGNNRPVAAFEVPAFLSNHLMVQKPINARNAPAQTPTQTLSSTPNERAISESADRNRYKRRRPGWRRPEKTTASRSNKLKTMVIILILSFSLFLLLLKTTKNQLIYPFYQPQVCAGSVWSF